MSKSFASRSFGGDIWLCCVVPPQKNEHSSRRWRPGTQKLWRLRAMLDVKGHCREGKESPELCECEIKETVESCEECGFCGLKNAERRFGNDD